MSVALTGTSHFTLGEVQAAGQWPIPPEYQANAQATLELLERVRAILGTPLRLTNLYRTAEHNADLPGSSPTSQHLTADAGDVVPVGLSLDAAAQLWAAAVADGRAGDFGQFIVEQDAVDGLKAHIHVSRGTRAQSLVRLADGTYHELLAWLASIGEQVQQFGEDVQQFVQEQPGAAGVALLLGFRRGLARARELAGAALTPALAGGA